MSLSETEKEERLARELIGDSKDRALGRLLDYRAHRLICAILDKNKEPIRELCTEDVTLVSGFLGSQDVCEGLDEVAEFCVNFRAVIQIVITIVDRRHIICPVNVLTSIDDFSHTHQRMVMIFDADEACKMKRIEIRPLSEVENRHGIGVECVVNHVEIAADNGL
ncbi:hypothetical protein LX32DRAFT_216112 [Colletotrichum zoysiae]|uniref:Uncharacterized protein n=1 Tax=Colletotrichum zoysiae TaxID=1216348 RepID=A0AAD9LU14_9PEZI|nr:hypothetical protein LX32DRAFT_216112 [Colletotrichum zoysiae]